MHTVRKSDALYGAEAGLPQILMHEPLASNAVVRLSAASSSISGTQTGLSATPLFSPSHLPGTLYALTKGAKS